MSATVRIKPATYSKLKDLCHETGDAIPAVLDKAIEAYRRQRFLDEAATAYHALKKNSKLWKEELAERKAWDATSKDGLKKE